MNYYGIIIKIIDKTLPHYSVGNLFRTMHNYKS